MMRSTVLWESPNSRAMVFWGGVLLWIPGRRGAVLAFVAFGLDEQCSSDSLVVDEGGFPGVMVVVF